MVNPEKPKIAVQLSGHQRLAEHPDLVRIPVLYLVGTRAMRNGAPRLPPATTLHKPIAISELLEKIEANLRTTRASRPRAA